MRIHKQRPVEIQPGTVLLFIEPIVALLNRLLQMTSLHLSNLLPKVVQCCANGIEGRGGYFFVMLHAQPVQGFGVPFVQRQCTFCQKTDVSDVIAYIPEVGVECL